MTTDTWGVWCLHENDWIATAGSEKEAWWALLETSAHSLHSWELVIRGIGERAGDEDWVECPDCRGETTCWHCDQDCPTCDGTGEVEADL